LQECPELSLDLMPLMPVKSSMFRVIHHLLHQGDYAG